MGRLSSAAVVIASFATYMWSWGAFYASSVLFETWRSEFQGSYHSTAWVLAIFPATQQLASVVSAGIAERFGPRRTTLFGAVISALGYLFASWAQELYHLYFCMAIQGVGCSLLTISSAATAGQYFSASRRKLAMGIASSGSGVGTAIMAPMFYHMHAAHGWRWAFRAVAGASFLSNLASSYFIVPRSTLAKPVDGPPMATRMPFTFALLRDPVYRCLLVAVPLLYAGVWVLPVFTAPYAATLGWTPSQVATLVAVVGVATAAARLCVGTVVSYFSVSSVCVASLLARAAATFWLPFVRGSAALWVVAVGAAVLGAASLALPRLVATHFPMSYLQSILASLYTVAGIASAVGPPAMGLLVDAAVGIPSKLDGVEFAEVTPQAFQVGGVTFGCALAVAALPIACLAHAARGDRVTGLLDVDMSKTMFLAPGAANRSVVTLSSGSSDEDEEGAPFIPERV